MKLWLLKPIPDERGNDEHGAWYPWYDKTFGLVVRAETEGDARRVAADGSYGDEGKAPWLDAAQSSCVELTADGEPAVILADHRSA